MTNYEEVIREAALKNRVGLQQDDPHMVLVTILNKIAVDWQGSLDAALEAHKIAHEEIAHRWRKDAAKQAEKVINAALVASREAMAKGMNEGTEKVLELVRKDQRDAFQNAMNEQKADLAKTMDEFRQYIKAVTTAIGIGLVGAVLIALFL